jgi:hypothetical protein
MGLTLLAMQGGNVVNYSPYLESLQFSSVSPGGFGVLRARLLLPSSRARLPRPELAVLSGRVVLMDGRDCVYSGEVQEAALFLDVQGEGVDVVAQGGGGALSDDPQDSSYTSQTAQAIIAAEFSKRSAYLAVDADQSAVLPNAPAVTFSPAYDGRSLEDILHELCDLLGDYVWGVWDHSVHRDQYGLPAWQLQMHQRDTATLGYQANIADVVSWRIAPSAARAFNGVTLHYLDPLAGPGSVTATDARLGGGLSQGNAPFRFRRFRRDLGNRPLTASQATALANQYLASFQNVQNVIAVTLAGARNAQGIAIPIHRVRADRNIAIPELLPRALSFPATPALQAGTNLFYIRQATYREQRGQAPALTLYLDQIADFAAADQARQRYEEQLRQRSKRQPPPVQPAGQPLTGYISVRWGAASGANNVWSSAIQFPTIMANVPTGINFSAISSSNVKSGPTATNITAYGCEVLFTANAAGAGNWAGTYTTVGN